MKTKIWEKKLKLEKLKLSEEITNLSRDPPLPFLGSPPKPHGTFWGPPRKPHRPLEVPSPTRTPQKSFFGVPRVLPDPPFARTRIDLQTPATAWQAAEVGKSTGRLGSPKMVTRGRNPRWATNSWQWSSVVLLLRIDSTNFICGRRKIGRFGEGGNLAFGGGGGGCIPPQKTLKEGVNPFFFISPR